MLPAPRDVVILGSTGSIGTQALDIARRNPERFRVAALAAGGGSAGLLARPGGRSSACRWSRWPTPRQPRPSTAAIKEELARTTAGSPAATRSPSSRARTRCATWRPCPATSCSTA